LNKTQPDTVITGARSISNATVNAEDLRRPKPRIAYADEPKAPYPTRFQSISQSRIVTINIRTQQVDGSMKDNKFNVLFEAGFVDISQRRYPFSTERVSQALQECTSYGLGKQFWDSDLFTEQAERKTFDDQLATAAALAKTDEGRAALRAVLGDSFQLPPAPSE
jgi:hypothetical protein